MSEVFMPGKPQQPMARRLFGMAAPIAGGIIGGIYGGPAGAAAGSAIGGTLGAKVNGESTQNSVMSGAQTGLGSIAQNGMGGKPKPEGLPAPIKADDSAFSRRYLNKQQDPQMALQNGLDALPNLSPELRQQYTEPLLRAQMMSGRRYG